MAGAKKIIDYKHVQKYPFPSDKINPELKKDESYGIAFCEAFLAEYASNSCFVPFQWDKVREENSPYSYEVLRAYAQGREGSDTVKKNFFGEKKRDRNTGKYPTTMNTNWESTDIMPKLFDVMRGINQKIEYKTTARAIDSDSLLSKRYDREYLKFLIDSRVKETSAMTKFKPNTPVSLEEIGAETESDIDLFFDSGAYITKREIASAAAAAKTRKESDFKTIQDMLFDDAITLGIMCGKNHIDRANNLVKTRYVDPAKCAIQYSSYLDHRNMTRFGEVRQMQIGELREEYPHISAGQWRTIARDFAYMNPESAAAISQVGYFSKETTNAFGQDLINNCNILVFDVQWLSDEVEKRLTNTKNPKFYKEVDFGYEVSKAREKTGDKVITKNFVTKYKASWIIGTKILLDYGKEDDIVYYGKDGNKIPKLDYFVQRIGNKSVVERCITHLEDIRLASVKLRNAVATLPPAPRMIIQQQLLDNVWLNGIQQQPEDLVQKFIEKGYLTVNNLDDFNKPIFQNAKAIDFIPNGVIEDINLFTSLINTGIDRLREVTGLNAGVDASTPDAYTGLGKMQMAAASSNNALSPTFNIFTPFFTRLTDDQIKKWQIVVKRCKNLKLDYAPLGINTMQTLELAEDFVNADFGIYTEMEFTDDQRQQLLARIIELNKNYAASNGATGLSTAEYMHLEELIMAGQFTFAKFVIARTEKKREMNALKAKRESEQFTFQSQKESAAAASQLRIKEVSDTERKKILSLRIAEIEKRITKLYESITAQNADAVVAASQPVDEHTESNTNAIYTLIQQNRAEINELIANDVAIDQQAMQPQQQQVA